MVSAAFRVFALGRLRPFDLFLLWVELTYFLLLVGLTYTLLLWVVSYQIYNGKIPLLQTKFSLFVITQNRKSTNGMKRVGNYAASRFT